MMMKDEVVKMNLDLLNEFMKYAFDNPDVLDSIPADAELVILPSDDPALYKENKKTVDPLLKEGKKVVVVEFKKPETILPKIELLSA